jgi:hypothetical protein
MSACPTMATHEKFLGPAGLAAIYRARRKTDNPSDVAHLLGLPDGEHGVWRCHSAFECTAACPQAVDPAGTVVGVLTVSYGLWLTWVIIHRVRLITPLPLAILNLSRSLEQSMGSNSQSRCSRPANLGRGSLKGEVMNLALMVEQPETMNPGADRYEYPRRFNLLDMFGISHALSPVGPRSDKFSRPEEDFYDNAIFDWEVVGQTRKHTSPDG